MRLGGLIRDPAKSVATTTRASDEQKDPPLTRTRFRFNSAQPAVLARAFLLVTRLRAKESYGRF